MPRIAYVNGRYQHLGHGVVSIEDRGFQFADGIYEVFLAADGVLWDLEGHMARLWRSLDELHIAHPMGEGALRLVLRELLLRNRLKNALVYLQITRGDAPRNHIFPPASVAPGIVLTAKPFDLAAGAATAAKGVRVISMEDIRWRRVDIKSVSLLPNVLAKQAAHEAGAAEAWLVRDGVVTEGSSSNAWIIDADGALRTHPKSRDILGGITRETVMRCAESLQIKVIEEAFTLADAKAANEAFLTSATMLVTPIIAIDGEPIANGAPGPIAARLRQAYREEALPKD